MSMQDKESLVKKAVETFTLLDFSHIPLSGWLEPETSFRQQIHLGMEEMYQMVHQATYTVFGIDEVYKLVMDEIEMHEIGRCIAKFQCEYSGNCGVSVVRAKTLC